MLSREDVSMIKQMGERYIIDIARQVDCSEKTVMRRLKYPEPLARKIRHNFQS